MDLGVLALSKIFMTANVKSTEMVNNLCSFKMVRLRGSNKSKAIIVSHIACTSYTLVLTPSKVQGAFRQEVTGK